MVRYKQYIQHKTDNVLAVGGAKKEGPGIGAESNNTLAIRAALINALKLSGIGKSKLISAITAVNSRIAIQSGFFISA